MRKITLEDLIFTGKELLDKRGVDSDKETVILHVAYCMGFPDLIEPHEYLRETPAYVCPKTGKVSHGICPSCLEIYQKKYP